MATTIQPNQKTTTKSEKAALAASRIRSVAEVNQWGKFVIYGRNGAGKTHWAADSGLKTLIIDCEEKGSETVVGMANQPNVDVFELERWEDLDMIFWHAKLNPGLYDVYVIDTVTMLSNICLKWILGDERSRDASLDPLMPDRRHYGKLNMALGQAIINWRNLPAHIVFLAQERTETLEGDDTDESATVLEVVPSLTKGPRGTLMSAVGTIGRIYTKDVTKTENGKEKVITERRLLVGADPRYASKTRISGLPRVIRNSSLKALLAHRAKYGELPVGEVNPVSAEEI